MTMVLVQIAEPASRNPTHQEGEFTEKTGEKPVYGGTLVWGTASKPTIINPILTQTSVSASLVSLIFDSLVRINAKGQVEPGIAESWTVSDDGLIYTFFLKSGVRFHDGIELTAEDVKFTYELIIDPRTQSPYQTHFEPVEKFETIGRYTFRVTLKKPFSPLIYKMTRFIVPKHSWANQDIQKADFNYRPVGSGFFKFKEWNQETDEIRLVANKDYFEGRPYLDEVRIKTYLNNSQLWSAVLRGEVDLVQYISEEDYEIINNDHRFKGFAVPGDMYYALIFNVQDPIWRDRELRWAVAHAINRREIMEAISEFESEECAGPFHSQSIGFDSKIQPIEYNPVKAKMILMHQGWLNKMQDNKGGEVAVRRKDRKDLELRLLVDARDKVYKKMAQIIRQQLSEIGIKVKIVSYNNDEDFIHAQNEEPSPQAWLRFFSGLGTNPDAAVESWYSSSQVSDFGNYYNEEVDELIQQGKIMAASLKKQEIYQKIHRLIYNDQPACFLFYPVWYFALRADFQGGAEYFSIFMPTHTMKNWYQSDQKQPFIP